MIDRYMHTFLSSHNTRTTLVLFAISIFPFWGFVEHLDTVDSMVVSIDGSEFPVKMWCYQYFSEWQLWLGGEVEGIGFPQSTVLNNPDITMAILLSGLHQVFGWVGGMVIVLWLSMLANVHAGYYMARTFGLSRTASYLTALGIAWNPLTIAYGFASVITDFVHLWPYVYAVGHLQRAITQESSGKVRDWYHPVLAGLFLSLGFITCPYNFVLCLPLVPIIVWWLYQNTEKWKKVILYLGGSTAVCTGLYAIRLWMIMHTESSLVDSVEVENIRHRYPFTELLPWRESRFSAFFSDYVGYYQPRYIYVEQVARFARNFQVGIFSWVVAVWGLIRLTAKHRVLWLPVFVVGFFASVGPFVPISNALYSKFPLNPIYLYVFYFPMGSMILEPFRYALWTYVAIAVCMGFAIHSMTSRYQIVIACVLGVEFAYHSLLPLPLQSVNWQPEMTVFTSHEMESGAIAHFPFFVPHSNRFDRSHFLAQLQHKQPITDPVMGFPPSFYLENPLLCSLLHAETVSFPLHLFPCQKGQFSLEFLTLDSPSGAREKIEQSLAQLHAIGLESIVFQRDKYDRSDWEKIRSLLDTISTHVEQQGTLFILRTQE